MADSVKPDLEERVARLEAAVERLLAAGTHPRPEPGPRPAPSAHASAPPSRVGPVPSKAPPRQDDLGTPWSRVPSSYAVGSERWLSRVGVGFVILSVVFLLKLSFDRGWITPPVRLAAAAAVALGLLVVGLRLEPTRRRLAQALLGGSIALFYIVGYAGFQLYELLPFWFALSLMSTTTVLAFVLSERQDSSPLAVIGIAGGLATPFLLDTGTPHPNGLAAYLALVLLGGGAVQFHRGWRSLLAVLVVLGAAALTPLALTSRGVISLALLAVAIYWVVTAVSRVLAPVIRPQEHALVDMDSELWISRGTVGAATVVAFMLVVGLARLELRGAGMLLLLVGLAAAATAYRTRGTMLAQWPSAEISSLCFAFGLLLFVHGPSAMFFGVVEAAALFILATKGAPASLRDVGHVLVAAVVVAFLYFAANAPISGVTREGALLRLAVVGTIAVCSLLLEGEAVGVYRGIAYVGLLVWLLSELAPRPHGAALVSITWAVQGSAALLVSLRTGSQAQQMAGLATLGLVAVKLLLVDLSHLDAVWRILMFLGFGACLLGLAYLVNRPTTPEVGGRRTFGDS